MPTAKDLGFIWGGMVLRQEAAAQARLESLAIALLMNTKKRNFPSVNGTSQLSAALKFGVIGIRTVWAATIARK